MTAMEIVASASRTTIMTKMSIVELLPADASRTRGA
jgi:hypothetical protein